MKMSRATASKPEYSAPTTRPKCKRGLLLVQLASPQFQKADFSPSSFSFGRFLVSLVALTLIFGLSGESAESAPPQKLPVLTDVMAYVDRHFANTTDFRPGDIISTSNVTPLFDGLELIGWKVPNRKSLLELVPGDNDYVVQQLRSEPGRKFMQQISNYPLGYDRMFHLARIPQGRQQVHDLIRTKDGYKMIEYMTTTTMGKNFGKQLSNSPRGADFNKPTGQIYTVEALKAELEKSYAITLQAIAKAAQ